MHHGAAGEVDGVDGGLGIPDAVHEAVDAPDHVGEREINHEHPEGDEERGWPRTSCARRSRRRSAPGVMMANISWYIEKTFCETQYA